jgi:hypothetical protein
MPRLAATTKHRRRLISIELRRAAWFSTLTMLARRDLLTGRLNFLHRSWGSVKPCDGWLTQRLHAENIYTHPISDHYQYW